MLTRDLLLKSWSSSAANNRFAAVFQKDSFLQDMAAQRQDFCSSLLVDVTLVYSCVWHFHASQKMALLINYY